jgi:Arc/MetJ-type ribon-helix-helix transcriptional regulator
MVSEGKQVEVEVTEVEVNEPKSKSQAQSAGESVGKAISNIMDSLEAALTGRGNTVMVRVNDEALEKLDMLVASGICSSRSEAAAFLLQRGIESSEPLFTRIADVTTQITTLRQELQEWVQERK